MGLLDLFSFKKEFVKVFNKENFTLLTTIAKEKIAEQVKEKAKKGEEKMDAVVEKGVEFIRKHMKSTNGLVNWITENILIPNFRTIAQALYDALKTKIKDL